MHIRSRLCESKCLIFLSKNDSVHSKRIPWELEFFDGRWGSPTVGLYIDDASKSRKRRRRAPKSNANEAAESSQTITIQEYLDIYRRVTNKTLPAFLADATSNDSLGNRQDVDVDRFMTLLASAGAPAAA